MENTENIIPEFDFEEMVIDVTEEDIKETQDLEVEKETEEEPEQEPVVEVQTEEPEVAVEKESDSQAKALYDTLVAKGILEADDNYDGSWEALDSYFDNLPERIADDIIQSAPDITKKIIEFAFVSGDSITKDSLKNFINTYLEDIDAATSEIDISTNDGARAFLKQELSKTIKQPVALEAALDALEDADELQSEAKLRLEEFKKQNKHQSLIDSKIQENNAAEERARNRNLAIQKELSSNEYAPQTVNEIINFWKTNDINAIVREAFNNPKAFVQLSMFLNKYDNQSKQFNFDSFVKEAGTPEVNKIKSKILKDNFTSLPKTTSKRESPNNKYDKIEPIIEF